MSVPAAPFTLANAASSCDVRQGGPAAVTIGVGESVRICVAVAEAVTAVSVVTLVGVGDGGCVGVATGVTVGPPPPQEVNRSTKAATIPRNISHTKRRSEGRDTS